MSTPSSRGQFAGFEPESDDDDDETNFRLFRLRPRRLLDESENDPIPAQGELDAAAVSVPERWTDRDVLLIKYNDDFNGVEKIYKKNPILSYSDN